VVVYTCSHVSPGCCAFLEPSIGVHEPVAAVTRGDHFVGVSIVHSSCSVTSEVLWQPKHNGVGLCQDEFNGTS
jgi:hypothetical protein